MWQIARPDRSGPADYCGMPGQLARFSIRATGVVVLGLLLTACATDRRHTPSVTRHTNGICTSEAPIGSHRPRQVCRTNAEVASDRKQAQGALNQIRNTPSSNVPRQ